MKNYQAIRENVPPQVISPLIAYRARRLVHGRIVENDSPSEGIYYVWYKPSGWDLFPYRFDEFGPIDHSELWEKYLVGILANLWAPKLKAKASSLESHLSQLVYAFPRGRISSTGRRYLVLHGNDSDKFCSRNTVERAFSIAGRCRWESDDHEVCQTPAKNEIRQLLKIKDDWKSIE